jgi:hypothetical protein
MWSDVKHTRNGISGFKIEEINFNDNNNFLRNVLQDLAVGTVEFLML